MRALADSPADYGLLGEQSSPKYQIPCTGRRRITVQNLTPLALSSAEKSVTVQEHKQKDKQKIQTVTDISTPCLLACVDKNNNKCLFHCHYQTQQSHTINYILSNELPYNTIQKRAMVDIRLCPGAATWRT